MMSKSEMSKSEINHCNCKKVLELLSAYIDSELSNDEKRMLDKHILQCQPCKVYLESLNYTVKLSVRLEKQESYQMPKDVRVKLRTFLKEKCQCDKDEER
jgi:anti-sigma factor RsiW